MTGKHGEPWRHTSAEPEYLDGIQSGETIWGEQSLVVAYGFDGPQMARATLCVNALEGISNEALEAGVVGKLREALEIAERALGNSPATYEHELPHIRDTLALLDKE